MTQSDQHTQMPGRAPAPDDGGTLRKAASIATILSLIVAVVGLLIAAACLGLFLLKIAPLLRDYVT